MTVMIERVADVLFRAVGDEIVLYDYDSDVAITVNGLGAVLWTLLETVQPVESLVAALAERHPGLDPTVVEADVGRFVAELSSLGMVRRQGPG